MTEPIEKWKEEFITNEYLKEFRDLSYSILSGGEIMFNDHTVDLRWEGFLMSKRIQPVVELPKPMYVHRPTIYRDGWEDGYDKAMRDAEEALTAAGINYRIKGE